MINVQKGHRDIYTLLEFLLPWHFSLNVDNLTTYLIRRGQSEGQCLEGKIWQWKSNVLQQRMSKEANLGLTEVAV